MIAKTVFSALPWKPRGWKDSQEVWNYGLTCEFFLNKQSKRTRLTQRLCDRIKVYNFHQGEQMTGPSHSARK